MPNISQDIFCMIGHNQRSATVWLSLWGLIMHGLIYLKM